MRIGIVGSEAKKFTVETEDKARSVIRSLLSVADGVVSGGCHLGGVDIWAVEEAKDLGLEVIECLPKSRRWNGGYKERNIEIAELSDRVVCITVEALPPGYVAMGFESPCYHCGTDKHIKSGGCWTAKYAGRLGKPYEIVVI